jgi:hypothetical protein
MTCPKCFSRLDGPRGVCPECGVSLYHNVSGIVKTSVVMISAGDENLGVAPAIAQRLEEPQITPASLEGDHSWRGLPWIAWAGFGVVLAAAAGISAFFGLHW